MSPIAFRQIRVSDLTGVELKDDDAVTVTVRHPDVSETKVFDASNDELAGLKPVRNLVSLDLRYPDGTTASIQVNKAEFDKVVPREVIDNAPGNRGRRPGYKPSNGNGA